MKTFTINANAITAACVVLLLGCSHEEANPRRMFDAGALAAGCVIMQSINAEHPITDPKILQDRAWEYYQKQLR